MSDQFTDINHQYYHDYYQFASRGKWMEKIWSEAFGAAYPQGLEHYGFLTQHDLSRVAELLQINDGGLLLDIGCGKGGPGLHIARELGLRLFGIDLIPAAIQQANEFKNRFELKYPAEFQEGQFYQIPLEDETADAVISFDSLWAAYDKVQALLEVKRVMKPDSQFIFTHWDLLATDPIPYFEATGLKVIAREETPNWKAFQSKVYEGIANHKQELKEEMGEAANMLFYEAEASPPYLDLSIRRIYHLHKPG